MTSYFEFDCHQKLIQTTYVVKLLSDKNEGNILMYPNSNNKSVILYMYNKQEVMGSW